VKSEPLGILSPAEKTHFLFSSPPSLLGCEFHLRIVGRIGKDKEGDLGSLGLDFRTESSHDQCHLNLEHKSDSNFYFLQTLPQAHLSISTPHQKTFIPVLLCERDSLCLSPPFSSCQTVKRSQDQTTLGCQGQISPQNSTFTTSAA